jgi:hypothetical protein
MAAAADLSMPPVRLVEARKQRERDAKPVHTTASM